MYNILYIFCILLKRSLKKRLKKIVFLLTKQSWRTTPKWRSHTLDWFRTCFCRSRFWNSPPRPISDPSFVRKKNRKMFSNFGKKTGRNQSGREKNTRFTYSWQASKASSRKFWNVALPNRPLGRHDWASSDTRAGRTRRRNRTAKVRRWAPPRAGRDSLVALGCPSRSQWCASSRRLSNSARTCSRRFWPDTTLEACNKAQAGRTRSCCSLVVSTASMVVFCPHSTNSLFRTRCRPFSPNSNV